MTFNESRLWISRMIAVVLYPLLMSAAAGIGALTVLPAIFFLSMLLMNDFSLPSLADLMSPHESKGGVVAIFSSVLMLLFTLATSNRLTLRLCKKIWFGGRKK